MLPRKKGPVAEWPFQDGPVQQLNWLTLKQSLTSCETMVSVLSAHRMLFPNSMCFSQWMRAGEHEVARGERVEKANVEVTMNPSNPFAQVFPLCRSFIDSESVYPLTIKI